MVWVFVNNYQVIIGGIEQIGCACAGVYLINDDVEC